MPHSLSASPRERLDLVVETPSRLHFGLFNQAGLWDRVGGGAGLAIASPRWKLRLRIAEGPRLIEGLAPELEAAAQPILSAGSKALEQEFHLTIESLVPCHVGLGSKTSLLMGLARGMQALGAPVGGSEHDLAAFVRRGGTSGIGVQTAIHGGLAMDFGHATQVHGGDYVPSSRSKRRPARGVGGLRPRGFRVVHFRFDNIGVSGTEEAAVFRDNCPTAPASTRETIAIWYGQLLPALLDGDEHSVQVGLSAMQSIGFKEAEWSIQGKKTQEFRQFFAAAWPDIALGLSSMGPTLYCITAGPERVLSAIASFPEPTLHVTVTHPDIVGTQIRYERS